jgi:hypothetical protein
MSLGQEKYVDEFHYIHCKGAMLGRGGQGIVFRTKDPDVAIKVDLDSKGEPLENPEVLKKYAEKIERIRLLPLPEGIELSLPAALLKERAGYVMQLLSDMVPFGFFWPSGKSENKVADADIPEWLGEVDRFTAKTILHYRDTGGLRRRLMALFKSSLLLAKLHGRGFVYGDVSHNNIFISESLDFSAVWFIDADNLRFEQTSGGGALYTCGYGAPEIMQGRDSARPATDCHAFAVLAFRMLSLIHPFIGKKVEGEDNDSDWADEEDETENPEEQAYAGYLPWVDDPEDDSNANHGGLPRTLVLTEKLRSLFERTFCAGRTSPPLRPAIFHWPEAFARAADSTLQCPSCGMSYYYPLEQEEDFQCPYCEVPPPRMLSLRSYRWHGAGRPLGKICWHFLREIEEEKPLVLPQRIFVPFCVNRADEPEMLLYLRGRDIFMEKTESSALSFALATETSCAGLFQEFFSKVRIKNGVGKDFWIFTASEDPRLILGSIMGGER